MSNLFNPEISWFKQLPSNLRPDDDKVIKWGQTPIYRIIERLEGQLKRLFKLKPKGRPEKKVDK